MSLEPLGDDDHGPCAGRLEPEPGGSWRGRARGKIGLLERCDPAHETAACAAVVEIDDGHRNADRDLPGIG